MKIAKGTKKARKKKPATRLDADGRREFLLDYCAGRVVSSLEVPENLLVSVFMPIIFGALEDIEPATIGAIYAVIGKDTSSGMAVNGYPIFFSCRILPTLDLAELIPAINAELQRRRELTP